MQALATRASTEEQLTEHVVRLARKTEALDDFAGLVAHDVKSSLLAALRADDPRAGLMHSLELVDSILTAVRVETAATGVARLDECVQQAVTDLGEIRAEVVSNVTGEFPIPPDALRLVVRNLLANAVAAGADRIYVSALSRDKQQLLVVDDDGVGIGAEIGYATGAQLGLRLCRRLVERCGGTLDLRPRAVGGTRAVIAVAGGSR
jgi:signal transduction histidine kinase